MKIKSPDFSGLFILALFIYKLKQFIEKKSPAYNVLVYSIFVCLAVILFLPVLNKPLASDDYDVMHRLVFKKQFSIRGFFRPVSDITLYFSYLIGGFNALYYNLLNIVIHAANAYLLYQICLRLNFFVSGNETFFSLFSALYFLTYPFHNESIIWVVGRASLVACFFAFLSLYIILSDKSLLLRVVLSCLFYFVGLCSYETIIPLPVIVLLLIYNEKESDFRFIKVLGIAYTVTLLLNLSIRYLTSALASGYGSKMFSIEHLLSRLFKGIGRLLLPPSENSSWLVFLFSIISLGLIIFFLVFRKQAKIRIRFLILLAVVFISALLPSLFGVSTKTIEGDRLLYFPSFFLSILVAFIVSCFHKKLLIYLSILCIISYNVYFLQMNVAVWKKSGEMVVLFLSDLKRAQAKLKTITVVNTPSDYKGAFIFRHGLKEAMLMNKIDTTRIKVLNTLTSVMGDSNDLVVVQNNSVVPIHVRYERGSVYFLNKENQLIQKRPVDSISHLFYWDGIKIVPIKNRH